MGWLLAPHPGISYLVLAVAFLVALGAAVQGRGLRRFLGPALIAAAVAAWAYLILGFDARRAREAAARFDAACREQARSEVRRTVGGVQEIFIEHAVSSHGPAAGLPNAVTDVMRPLLDEHPRYRRVAILGDGSPDLPRYGVRWQADAPQDGFGSYRMEIFDRVGGDVLGRQTSFSYRAPKAAYTLRCPIADPADFVRTVLTATAGGG